MHTANLAEVTTKVTPRRGLDRIHGPALTVSSVNALIHLSIATEEAAVVITVTDATATDKGVSFGRGNNFSGARIGRISGGDLTVSGAKQPKTALLTIKGRGDFQIEVQA